MGSTGTITTRVGHWGAEKAASLGTTVQDLIDTTLLFLRDRSTAYKRTFDVNSITAQIIYKDLCQFAHFGETTISPNETERLSERLRGRQDVIFRILQHTQLTPKQLFALYNNSPVPENIEREENDND